MKKHQECLHQHQPIITSTWVDVTYGVSRSDGTMKSTIQTNTKISIVNNKLYCRVSVCQEQIVSKWMGHDRSICDSGIS